MREDAGLPAAGHPQLSQIVGTQAVFNVLSLGERYKMVTKEFKGLVHGDYGKTPAPIKPEFIKQILGDEQPITCRFGRHAGARDGQAEGRGRQVRHRRKRTC